MPVRQRLPGRHCPALRDRLVRLETSLDSGKDYVSLADVVV
jgi:hypothetical protein